ncbi:MAG: VWA domain-containing protein [Bacteroidia bacterium]|nr:VWA domain-containing protein [Bacteroidia bacterium]
MTTTRRLFWVLMGTIGFSTSNAQPDLYFSTQKISSRPGSLTGPVADRGQLGTGVAVLGDVDGDGFEDIALSAPQDSGGAIWIVMLDSLQEVKSWYKNVPGQTGFVPALTPGGGFGVRLEGADDLTGDGIPDLWACEPGGTQGGLPYGNLWLLSLDRTGRITETRLYSGRTPGLSGLLGRSTRFGTDVTRLGDLDGNGVPDLAVAAAGEPDKTLGGVWIILFNPDASIRLVQLIQPDKGGFKETYTPNDQFGSAVAALGDVDGDGVPDLAAGARGDDATGFNHGAIWILMLKPDGTVRQSRKIASGQGAPVLPLNPDDRLGTSLAGIGDFNGDGVPDLAAGVPADDDGGKDKGAIYLLLLTRSGTVSAFHTISETSRNNALAFPAQYAWAQALKGMGDLTGDRRPELLVSGGQDNDGGPQRGAGWILVPGPVPESTLTTLRRPVLTAADSARVYAGATTRADSARIDSLYDLSGFAPSHLVLLLDVSASMSKPEKLPVLQEAFVTLLGYLSPEDKISIITYSGNPTRLLDASPASAYEDIRTAIQTLQSEGETKPARALQLAYEQARAHYIPQGNNRIIMATDGGFELAELDKTLEKFAAEDLPLSVFYFGKLAPLKQGEMVALAHRGHGYAAHITYDSVLGALMREIRVIRKK